MIAIHFDSKHDDQTRRRNLYNGAIYVYSPQQPGMELCDFAAEFCQMKFGVDPVTAHKHFSVDEYVEILKQLKPEFIHHPECKRLLPLMLRSFGCPEDETYFDVPRIRTACPDEYLSSGLAYAFKPHRDTWYSTPMCQLNWWLPVFPISSENGMVFHFNYWDRPIQNSSDGFNYQDWNQVGRKQAHQQGQKDTRVQSEALEEIDTAGESTLICEPGGLILFSAAHLHGTIRNTSGLTRFSLDFRTVNRSDLKAGAPNLDSNSTGTTMGDYLRCSDLQHFETELIEAHANAVSQV